MKKLLMAVAAITLLASCGDGKRTEPGAGGDTTARAPKADTSAAAMPTGSGPATTGAGGMKQEMGMMNTMMLRALGTSDSLYEQRFIDLMIAHHEGAIMMARDALTKATRPEIRKMAGLIIQTQQEEIDTMRAMRKRWYGSADPADVAGMAATMDTMNRRMTGSLGAKDSAYEERFINAMIPHHQGATMMGRNAVVNGKHPELQVMAEHIAKGQEKEITEMERLRAEWYGY